MQYRFLCVALSVLWLSGCSLLVPNVEPEVIQLKAGDYRLDPSHGALIFKIQHMGLSTFVGRFNHFDASLNFHPEQMANTSLNALVDTASVDTGNSALDEQLRSSTWLKTQQYPQAQFVSQATEFVADNHYKILGQLSLSGITRAVELDAYFHGGADNILTGFYTLGFSAKATIKRSDFSIDAYSGLVGDTVELEIYAEFQRR